MVSIKKVNKNLNISKTGFFDKFCIIFHFLSICLFASIQIIGRSIPLNSVLLLAAGEFCVWVQAAIDLYIPDRKYQFNTFP